MQPRIWDDPVEQQGGMMKRFSKWCLMAKILAVEIATTALFLLAVYALVRHEVEILLRTTVSGFVSVT
jgi:hypothetical protein